MATSQPAALRPVTLEQLIALNEEIAALVRVGVPLGQGLQRLGRDMPGRLGEVAQTLAERVNRGENLWRILEANPQTFPSAYRAVVAAGLRTGRLARALELLTETAEHLAEAHRIVVAAFVYPLMVFLLAWGLFVFFVLKIAPVVAIALSEFERLDVPFSLTWQVGGARRPGGAPRFLGPSWFRPEPGRSSAAGRCRLNLVPPACSWVGFRGRDGCSTISVLLFSRKCWVCWLKTTCLWTPPWYWQPSRSEAHD